MGERPELSALTTAEGGVLRFAPFTVGREQWLKVAEQTPGTTLYHRRRWLDLLRAALGINIQVATPEYGTAPVSGCLFARPARPFALRLISLPDPERCGPLAKDDECRDAFPRALASHPGPRGGFEIRGPAGPPPPRERVDTLIHRAYKHQMVRPIRAVEAPEVLKGDSSYE
jgi:hypothetical protein